MKQCVEKAKSANECYIPLDGSGEDHGTFEERVDVTSLKYVSHKGRGVNGNMWGEDDEDLHEDTGAEGTVSKKEEEFERIVDEQVGDGDGVDDVYQTDTPGSSRGVGTLPFKQIRELQNMYNSARDAGEFPHPLTSEPSFAEMDMPLPRVQMHNDGPSSFVLTPAFSSLCDILSGGLATYQIAFLPAQMLALQADGGSMTAQDTSTQSSPQTILKLTQSLGITQGWGENAVLCHKLAMPQDARSRK